jgi:hypothetical protein
VDATIGRGKRSNQVSRLQLIALTVIAAAAVIGALAFGVLRLYGS